MPTSINLCFKHLIIYMSGNFKEKLNLWNIMKYVHFIHCDVIMLSLVEYLFLWYSFIFRIAHSKMISNVVIDLGTVDLLFMQKYIWVVKDSIVHTNGPALNKLCSCEGKTLPPRKFLSKEKSSSYLMVGKTWMKCQSSTPMAVLIWNSLSLICDADSFSIRPCLVCVIGLFKFVQPFCWPLCSQKPPNAVVNFINF